VPSAAPPAARAGYGVGRLAIMGKPVLLPARHARRLAIGLPALVGISLPPLPLPVLFIAVMVALAPAIARRAHAGKRDPPGFAVRLILFL